MWKKKGYSVEDALKEISKSQKAWGEPNKINKSSYNEQWVY